MEQDRLIEALKAADAAGDVASATKLAQALRGMEAAPEPQETAAGNLAYSTRAATRGWTGGLSDYVDAGARYGIDQFRDKPMYGSYNDALKGQRADVNAYRESNPIAAYSNEIGGGVLSPLYKNAVGLANDGIAAAGKLFGYVPSRYAGYGVQGGAAGAVTGLGNAQSDDGGLPSAGDVAKSVVSNTAIGTGVGVSLPGIAEGGRWAANKAVQPFVDRIAKSGPANAAARKTVEALESRGMTPEQLAAKMRVRNQDGQGMIADVLPELAEDAAQVRGPAQNAAVRNLTTRQGTIMSPSGQGDRISQSVFKNLSGENFQQTVDDLSAARSADASPKYDKAFGFDTGEDYKMVKSELVDRLMTRPVFRNGLRRGIADALDEGAITGKDVRTFKTYLEGSGLNEKDVVLKQTPTIRILDAAKQGLDSILQEGGKKIRHPVTGRMTKRGRRIEHMRSELVDELDRLTPKNPETGVSTYKEARDAWAGPSRSIDMMSRGRQFIKEGGADETKAFFGKLSESEKEFYRIGVAKQLKDMLEAAGDEANKAKKVFGNEMMRGKLEALFKTRAEFNDFRKQILLESERSNTKQTVIGNSATGRRLAGQEQFGFDPTGPAIDIATGNVRGGAVNMLRQGARALTAPPKKTAAELAVLFSRDPAKQQQFIDSLSNRAIASRLLGHGPLPRTLPPFGGPSLSTGGSNQ